MSDKFCELYYPFTRGFNDAPLYENAAEWRRASVVLFDPSLPFLMTCSTQALWSSVNPVHPHKHETTPSSPLLKDQSVIIIGATPRKEWKRKMYNCILDGRSVVRELMSLGDGIKLPSHWLFQMMCTVSAAPEHQSGVQACQTISVFSSSTLLERKPVFKDFKISVISIAVRIGLPLGLSSEDYTSPFRASVRTPEMGTNLCCYWRPKWGFSPGFWQHRVTAPSKHSPQLEQQASPECHLLSGQSILVSDRKVWIRQGKQVCGFHS